jgi:hypothetical protein
MEKGPVFFAEGRLRFGLRVQLKNIRQGQLKPVRFTR